MVSIFAGFCAIAQQKEIDRNFSKSLFFDVGYPIQLYNNCVPTACLIKLETDSVGHVWDIKLSDSADSLLKNNVYNNRHKLDIASLEKSIKAAYGNRGIATYIIPLSYSIDKTICPVEKPINMKGYFTFNGKTPLVGAVIILPPMEFYKIKIQN